MLTSDAALLAPPRASAKRLVLYIVCHEHDGYDEDDVREIIATYVATCHDAGLDPLVVVSQLLLESDNLTSASADLRQLDPMRICPPDSGRSATSSEDDPPLFASWAEVARVHVGTLVAYALPQGAENLRQRALLEEASRWRPVPDVLRGSAPTIDRLAAAWGRDESYVHRIRDIAETISQPQW